MKNVPESNGRVGMLGSSYEGFTVVMALVNPHPALKVAAPMSPMVDGWMGDDWFHYGAFRQTNFDYFTGQTTVSGSGGAIVRQGYDDYENFLRAGSAGDFAKADGLDQLAFWRKIARASGLRRVLAGAGTRQDPGHAAAEGADDVDQGALGPGGHVGRDPRLSGDGAEGHGQHMNFLVMGPWRHTRRELRGHDARPAQAAPATPRSSSVATC